MRSACFSEYKVKPTQVAVVKMLLDCLLSVCLSLPLLFRPFQKESYRKEPIWPWALAQVSKMCTFLIGCGLLML